MKKFFKEYYSPIFFLILSLAGCNNSEEVQKDNTVSLEVGNQTIQAEVADSPQEWELGLSYRDTLADDYGMLFVFPDESRRVFWMRGCNFDIDLAYIESDGTISEIINMKKEPLTTPPESLTTYPSQSTTIKYALEMIGGWFEEHNIDTTAKVNLDQFSN
ncbi:MAG: DUF192 domain-containing protein [candidate division WOR-3 bacterium]